MRKPAAYLLIFFVLSALLAHARILWFLPDPIFELDSVSYFSPVLDLLFKGQFSLIEARTPGYPLFLWLCFSIAPHFLIVLVTQHVIALANAAFVSFLYYSTFQKSKPAAVVAGLLYAVFSGPLLFSHAVMSETLYTFFLLAAIAAFFLAEQRAATGWWFACAILSFCAFFVRPVGQALILSLVFFAALNGAQSRKGILVFAATLASLVLLWCGSNYLWRGFFGTTNFGGISLFGATARWLDVERLEDPVRAALRPIYAASAPKLNDPNWVRYSSDGPVQALRDTGYVGRELDRTLRKLAVTAVLQHPIAFICEQTAFFGRFVWRRSGSPKYLVSKEFSYFGGLEIFRKSVENNPLYMGLLRFREENAEAAFNRLQALRLYPYNWDDPWLWWLAPIRILEAIVVVGGFVLGIAALFLGGRKRETTFLLLVVVGHIVLTGLGGDETGRHAIPIEPLCLLLVFEGGRRLFLLTRPK